MLNAAGACEHNLNILERDALFPWCPLVGEPAPGSCRIFQILLRVTCKKDPIKKFLMVL